LRRAFLLSAALLCVALAGCEPKQRAACPAGKLCLHAANQSDPETLDLTKTALVIEDNIISDLFVGLVTDDVKGEPIPGAAESWSTSPDGLVWTFKLRPHLWSDGTAVTAQDFVFSWRRLADPKTAAQYAYFVYVIKNGQAVNGGKAPLEALGVKALDDRTLQVTLEHPVPYLPELVKHQVFYPTPEHVVRKWGDAWAAPGHMVSNGPYTLASWVLGDKIRLLKNPSFYDAKNVCLDEVIYYPIADPTSAERQVRRGELDMSNTLRSSRVAYLRRPDQVPAYVHTATYLGIEYLALNTHVQAFRDKRVRLALDMALDREFYVNKLMRAGELPAYGFVPPGVANYPGGVKVFFADWPLEKRQAEARRLLAESGYGPKHPLKFEFLYNTGANAALPPAIQADLRAVGVDASLVQAEGQIQFASLNARNFEMSVAGWIADYDDPNTFLYLLQSTTGQQNYGDYNNPAYDALLNKADHEASASARAAYLMRAEKAMIDDAAVLPLYYWVSRNFVSPKITGWADNIVDHHRKRWMCFSDAAARRAAAGR
jgi:oligopeptide transport system substrate-binding protein